MKRRNIFIPKPIWVELQERAEKLDVSASELIRKILSDWLEKNKSNVEETE